MDESDLSHRFHSGPLSAERNGELQEIRQAFYRLAVTINDSISDGREKALAVTSLETAMSWVRDAFERGNAP